MIYLINDRFTKEKNAKIKITSSLLRGYGIFETLRTYGKRQLPLKEEHIARLLKSAKQINLEIKYSKEALAKMLEKISHKSPHQKQIIKIIALEKTLIITSSRLKSKSSQNKEASCMSKVCTRALPEVKSISYLPSLLSHEEAVKKGYQEAILTDKNAEVYEGAYSNIFWFEGDNLCTREDLVLPGIIRGIILKISPYKLKFKTIHLSKLKKMEEVFLTSSIQGITPITKIDQSKIGNGRPGKKTATLNLALSEYINSNKK